MIKTIFRGTFLVGVLVLILCGVLFFGVQYTQTKEENYTALAQEALYVEKGLMMDGVSYLESLDDANRITWIASDGSVIFDNGESLPTADQSEFPEVRSAVETGEGHASRRADDGGASTIYYARRCADGSILRLGRPVSIVRYALAAVSPVLWVLVLVLLISGVLAFRVAKQIVKPINEIDLDRLDDKTYPELSPLIARIREQKMAIEEESEQREQMRREFSANVSHELKTPLTSISGFAELMAQGLVEEKKMREFSMDIYKESQRTITLVDDIIKLSKLDEGGIDPEWKEVDLYKLSEEIIETLRPIADRMSVSFSIIGSHAKISGVEQILNEMIYNLCDNAIKYNRSGGSVVIEVSQADDGARISVSDTGIGIPAEYQKRVFERFYRVDKSHSKEIGGTGLGLSIVKHGAQFHGAVVSLESEVGVGTTVTLQFKRHTPTVQ